MCGYFITCVILSGVTTRPTVGCKCPSSESHFWRDVTEMITEFCIIVQTLSNLVRYNLWYFLTIYCNVVTL